MFALIISISEWIYSLSFNFHGMELHLLYCLLTGWEERVNLRDHEEVSWYADWLQYRLSVLRHQDDRIETRTALKMLSLPCFVRNSRVIEALGQRCDYSTSLKRFDCQASSTRPLQIHPLPIFFARSPLHLSQLDFVTCDDPADIIVATTENSTTTRLFQAAVSREIMGDYWCLATSIGCCFQVTWWLG